MQRLTKQLETKFHIGMVDALASEGVSLSRTQSHLRVPRSKRRATVSALRRLGWRAIGSSPANAKVYARTDGSWPVMLSRDDNSLCVVASSLELPPELEALRRKSAWFINDTGVLQMSATHTPAFEKQARDAQAKAERVHGLIWQARNRIADHEFSVHVYASTVCVTVWPPVRHKQ